MTKAFYDNETVSINANIVRITTFANKSGKTMAYLVTASQAGERTNWHEFLVRSKDIQKLADVYRQVQKAPKGHKKVNVFASIWQDKNFAKDHVDHYTLLNIRRIVPKRKRPAKRTVKIDDSDLPF